MKSFLYVSYPQKAIGVTGVFMPISWDYKMLLEKVPALLRRHHASLWHFESVGVLRRSVLYFMHREIDIAWALLLPSLELKVA